jgi:hypothetical protein
MNQPANFIPIPTIEAKHRRPIPSPKVIHETINSETSNIRNLPGTSSKHQNSSTNKGYPTGYIMAWYCETCGVGLFFLALKPLLMACEVSEHWKSMELLSLLPQPAFLDLHRLES